MTRKTRILLMGMYFSAASFALHPILGASDGLQPWELWGQLPKNVNGNTLAANGEFWYAFADSGAVEDQTATYYSHVATDGTVGPWIRSPEDRTLFRAGLSSAVATESYVYLVAGKGDTVLIDTKVVEYATIDANGSLGPWQRTSPLNIARETFGLVVHGDFIYALGGSISIVGFGAGREVEFAHINDNGTLDPWVRGPKLNESHPSCAAAAVDGYIYVFAGGVHDYRTMKVERAHIDQQDGSLSAWEDDTPLPQFRSNLGVAVFGNSIYLAGGHAGTFGTDQLTSVIVSEVQPDHTLGPWKETEELIQASVNKRLTLVGGHVVATGDGLEIEHSVVECFGGFLDPATPELISTFVSTKNRFLSFSAGELGASQAVRVTFVDLPPPFDLWNGAELWVGPSSEVSEAGADVLPTEGFPNFTAATLQCTPFYADFSALGVVHVFHEGIVPGGTYSIQVIDELCDVTIEAGFSPPLTLDTTIWGDTVLDLSEDPPRPPEGPPPIDIVDALAILEAFSNVPGAIIKARADLEPGCLDLLINVSDVLASLSGFSGIPYQFTPTAADPCGSTCVNPLP